MLKRLVSRHPEIQNKNIPKVSLGNGTIKGVPRPLEKVNSAIITSSQPSHTIRTPYLEDPDGSQPLPRTMINTWTEGEDDESGTGKGMTHLKDYKFRFLLIGQLKVSEYICRPQQQGFQNRMPMGVYRGNVMPKQDRTGQKQDRKDRKQDISGVKCTRNRSGRNRSVLVC